MPPATPLKAALLGSALVLGLSGCASTPGPEPVSGMTLRFENFTMDQVLSLKARMEQAFPDTGRDGRISGAEPVIQYAYRTRVPQDRMVGWLHGAVQDMGIADAKILADGSRLTLKRLGSDLPAPADAPPGGRFR